MELTRREFVKLSLATGAAVGLAGCAIPPHQTLVSQLDLPEYRLPGVARWFATTCQECEGGCGVSIRVIDGRAKKIEGIPEHPVNHGKVCTRGHSSLQALYNPDRLTSSWQKQGDKLAPVQDMKTVVKTLAKQLDHAAPGSLWITKSLSGSRGALTAFLAEKAGAKLWVLDFPGSQPERMAMKSLTGKPQLPYYDILEADYVVNFGSNFLMSGHAPVHDAWQYGEFRQGKNRRSIGRGIMISFAPRANMTVANSDKWIPCKPGTEGWAAIGLGNLLAKSKKGPWLKWASAISLSTVSKMTGVPQEIFERVAARLQNARKPLAIAGIENGLYTNGVWSITIIQHLNRLLSGKLQTFEPAALVPVPSQKNVSPKTFIPAQEAIAGLSSGKFDTVWVFDTNPAYLLPAKLNFDKLFSKAKNKVVFTPYMNETALSADWVVATQSWMEEWGDRLIDAPYGLKQKREVIYNVQQPVAQVPNWSGSMDIANLLISASRESSKIKNSVPWKTMRDLLKMHFPDEHTWENLLIRGGVWENYPLNQKHPLYPPPVAESKGKSPRGLSAWDHLKRIAVLDAKEPEFSGDKQGQVLIPFYSANFGDGSLANRPWMQELPDPLASTVWTSWVELPLPLATHLGVERGDVVEVSSAAGTLLCPAFPNPGLHDDAVAIPVGQGHDAYGQYADNHGVNPLSILEANWQEDTQELAWVSTRVQVKKTGGKARLITLDTRMDRLPSEVLTI